MGDATTVHLTEQNFDEALAANQSVMMVDFWAEWCGPCRAIAPVLEDLARESAGAVTLAKVNIDENPSLAARYGIRSIPTVLFVKQGKVADQAIGPSRRPSSRRSWTRSPDRSPSQAPDVLVPTAQRPTFSSRRARSPAHRAAPTACSVASTRRSRDERSDDRAGGDPPHPPGSDAG